MIKRRHFIFMPVLPLLINCVATNAHANDLRNIEFGNVKIKLSGRALFDASSVSSDFGELSPAPTRDYDNSTIQLRRIVWSAEGKIGNLWKFKTEHGFMHDKPQWDDAYLEYAAKNYSIYIGSNYQTNSKEGQTSSGVYNFAQRSIITSAFGQSGRNVGLAYRAFGDNWQWTTGFYGDNINTPLDKIFAKQQFVQTRFSYAPINKKDETLHFGVSLRNRFREDEALFSYSARPIGAMSGTSYLQTGAISKSDTTFGIEYYYAKNGNFINFENQILSANTQFGTLDFNGSFLEFGHYFTGEIAPYNSGRGVTSYIKPKNDFGAGYWGAIGIVARLEYLDLKDGDLGTQGAINSAWRNRGGLAKGYSIGINWHPKERLILRTSYSHTDFDDTRGEIISSGQIINNPQGFGKTNIFNIRLQIGF